MEVINALRTGGGIEKGVQVFLAGQWVIADILESYFSGEEFAANGFDNFDKIKDASLSKCFIEVLGELPDSTGNDDEMRERITEDINNGADAIKANVMKMCAGRYASSEDISALSKVREELSNLAASKLAQWAAADIAESYETGEEIISHGFKNYNELKEASLDKSITTLLKEPLDFKLSSDDTTVRDHAAAQMNDGIIKGAILVRYVKTRYGAVLTDDSIAKMTIVLGEALEPGMLENLARNLNE